MIINGTDTQLIFCEDFKYEPDSIYVNNILRTNNNANKKNVFNYLSKLIILLLNLIKTIK